MDGVSEEDAGAYQCMIVKLDGGELQKDTRTISVIIKAQVSKET